MEATPRLKAGIFVRALLRRVQVEGASAFVVRSGAEEAGAIILIVARLDGTVLALNQVRDAKAGKTAAAPSPASLEAAFAPGRWLFKVC